MVSRKLLALNSGRREDNEIEYIGQEDLFCIGAII